MLFDVIVCVFVVVLVVSHIDNDEDNEYFSRERAFDRCDQNY